MARLYTTFLLTIRPHSVETLNLVLVFVWTWIALFHLQAELQLTVLRFIHRSTMCMLKLFLTIYHTYFEVKPLLCAKSNSRWYTVSENIQGPHWGEFISLLILTIHLSCWLLYLDDFSKQILFLSFFPFFLNTGKSKMTFCVFLYEG